MNSMILMFGFLISSNCVVTSYQSKKSQTDDSPFHTSIGERTGTHVVAASKDLLCSRAKILTNNKGFILCKRGLLCPNVNKLHYKDWIWIEGIGFKQILDIMHPRHKNHFDVWVRSQEEEARFGVKKLRVYFIRSAPYEKNQKN